MPLFDKNKPGIPKKSFLSVFKNLKNPRPMSHSGLTPKDKGKLGKDIMSDHHIKGGYVELSELTKIQKNLKHKVMVTHDPIEKAKMQDKINMIEQLKKK